MRTTVLRAAVFLSAFAGAFATKLAGRQSGCPAVATQPGPTSVAKLPDPFTMNDGTPVTTVDQWACRRAEISDMFQNLELGVLPGPPDSLSATFDGTNLAITVTVGSNTVTFTPTIKFPTTGTGPFPVVIGIGGISVPVPAGVATMSFNNNDIAQQNNQSSRGVGKFFTLFPNLANNGAMIPWAWAIGRIIDAMEMVNTGLDLSRIAVTGCSRNGKGAMVAGAFEERIALTIVQESGSGGAGSWRISDAMFAQGEVTQTAMEIVQENVWFSTAFDPFATAVPTLPIDHHMLVGLIAPRPVFVIENSDILWLGPESTFGAMISGHTIFEALNIPDRMGFSQVGNHSHCQFPVAVQGPTLAAFFNKFFFGQADADTSVLESDGNGFGFVRSDWIDWEVPSLT